ncbi:MMS19 nucleotide excision repair protein [[Candida] zeylanoides]
MADSVHDPTTVVSQYIACTTDSHDPSASKTYSDVLADILHSKELTLLRFIQVLGPYLTSESDLIRPKAIQCIADTLEALLLLEPKILSRQDLTVLSEFLVAKFDDGGSVQYILRALRCLCQSPSQPRSLANDIMTALVERYNPRQHLSKVRYQSFLLVQTILRQGQLERDLVVRTYLHVATGEKDPRNLLISFDLNRAIASSFNFDAEQDKDVLADLFDVAFCYFPISFTPPADDPYKITADMLKERLRSAISGQSLYAGDAFTSLIEKLTSTNPVVRNDVLKTLMECVKQYDADQVQQYWLTIWHALKYEVLHNDVSMFDANKADSFDELDTLDDTNEFKPLYLTLSIIDQLGVKCDDVARVVTDELATNLSNVTDKVFKQSVLLASAVAGSTETNFNHIVDFVFSFKVWGKYIGNIEEVKPVDGDEVEITSEDVTLPVAKQRELIDNMGFIFGAYTRLSHREGETFMETNQLVVYKDSLLIFFGQLLQTSSNLEKTLKVKVVQQLSQLVRMPQFLSMAERGLVFAYFDEILGATIDAEPRDWQRDVVLLEVKSAMTSIMAVESATNVELVIEKVFPSLLNRIPDCQAGPQTGDQVDRLFGLVGDLCTSYKLLEVLSIRLLNRLSAYSANDSHNYFVATVNLLVNCIIKIEGQTQFLMNSWYKNFVPRFLVAVVRLITRSSSALGVEEVVEVSGDLLALIIRYIDKSQHEGILHDFVGYFTREETKIVNERSEGRVKSLLTSPNVLINMFVKVLAAVQRPARGAAPVDTALLVSTSVDFASQTLDSVYTHLGYLKCLALAFNKFDDANDEGPFLQEYFGPIEEASRTKAVLTEQTLVDVEVFVWAIKGLAMRMDASAMAYLNKWVRMLSSSNAQLRSLVAQSLSIVFVDLPLFASGSSAKLISGVQSSNVRLLYKQRLFDDVLPILQDGFQLSGGTGVQEKDAKPGYLVALSNILRNVSSKVLSPHLSTITPLLLTSLSIANREILQSSLETITIIVQEAPEVISPHLAVVIPRLTAVATHADAVNTESNRLLALKCLAAIFSSMESGLTLRFQKTTIKELVIGLDDKRRNVRKTTSDLRQALYEMKSS